MLEALKDRPIEFDEDCTKLTEEQLLQFKRISEERQEERRKQFVTLRLSSQAVRTAFHIILRAKRGCRFIAAAPFFSIIESLDDFVKRLQEKHIDKRQKVRYNST